ncbi:MAG: hypothetical protein JSV97_00515 [candidate division WOR-3 bacterium]|nr:MAG: hypothetical protein JSV97_00515 [candidate division WOR-3 bacterium]
MLDRTNSSDTKIFLDGNLTLEVDDSPFLEEFVGLWVKMLNQNQTASVNFDDISPWQ